MTAAPDRNGFPSATILTRIEVDGQMWPVTAYRFEAEVKGVPRLTLTFEADVTIERPDPVPA